MQPLLAFPQSLFPDLPHRDVAQHDENARPVLVPEVRRPDGDIHHRPVQAHNLLLSLRHCAAPCEQMPDTLGDRLVIVRLNHVIDPFSVQFLRLGGAE